MLQTGLLLTCRRAAATRALLLAALAGGCDSRPTEPPAVTAGTPVPTLEAIAFAAGVFVGVGQTLVFGEGGSAVHPTDSVLIVRSTDGEAWSAVSPPYGGVLRGVAFGRGRWLAVGSDADDPGNESRIMASDDGLAWQPIEAPGNIRWSSIAYGNGVFVAVGVDPASAASVVMVSEDGLTWTETAEAWLLDARVSFGGGRFVLWGESGGVGVSADGANWNVRGVPFINRVTALVHAGAGWIGSGLYDCCFGEVPELVKHYDLGSSDGESWQSQRRERPDILFDIDILNGTLTAAAGDRLLSSGPEGGWRSVKELGQGEAVFHLACSDTVCVAAGLILATTADLETWTLHEVPH